MLEHLLDPEFTDITETDVTDLLEAQANTTSLVDFDAHANVLTDIQRKRVQGTFAAVANPDLPVEAKKEAIIALRVPQAVRHLAGMLNEYDWEFVEQAKQLRGYVVAKLLEETKHHDARIRLKALELTGKLTEVGSFTERIEITKKDASAAELEERIRARLTKLLPPVQEVETIAVKPPAPFDPPSPAPDPAA